MNFVEVRLQGCRALERLAAALLPAEEAGVLPGTARVGRDGLGVPAVLCAVRRQETLSRVLRDLCGNTIRANLKITPAHEG